MDIIGIFKRYPSLLALLAGAVVVIILLLAAIPTPFKELDNSLLDCISSFGR